MAALLDRLYNLHWVTPEVARSAQPYLGFYETFLKAHGFRAIVNLRGGNPMHLWWTQEVRVVARLGLVHYNVRLSSRLLPARKSLLDLVEAIASAPRPVLVKCSGGQDRTGFAAAVILLREGGAAAKDAAAAQLRFWPYLHRPKRYQHWLRHFPQFAVEEMGEQRFDAWARNGYDPERFAAWLKAKGHPASYRAVQNA
jgi:protein tyrosine/serine phosphatase